MIWRRMKTNYTSWAGGTALVDRNLGSPTVADVPRSEVRNTEQNRIKQAANVQCVRDENSPGTTVDDADQGLVAVE